MLTASISIVVPALPDNDVWFANAQAWSNYWRDIVAEATFDPAVTTAYSEVDYNTELVPCFQNIDGTDYVLITAAMFNSLKDRLEALNLAFKDMRTQLKAAGFITQAQ